MTSAWQEQRPQPLSGFRILQFGLAPPRQDLYARINARCSEMFARGLIEETRHLVEQYGDDCRALGSLGYAEARLVLTGRFSLADAIAATRQGHRNYAKRQGTWFRKDPRIHWIENFGEQSVAEVLGKIQQL